MSHSPPKIDQATLIRRILFVVLLASMAGGNLFVLFRGLSSPQAMDQAQLGREIARGNGYSTKFIRPAAYHQATTVEGHAASLKNFQDTYHSPLNPLINAAVLKLVGGDNADTWQMGTNNLVYELDRVIAAISLLFFIAAIGINYLLISRIFDGKIAAVCALLMLFSEIMWNYALSGLPQMLMLFLFSCALYFIFRALEAAEEERVAMPHAIVAGIFLTLLALTHWMTVWIALGYIIFAAIAFRPRAMTGVIVFAMILVSSAYFMVRNHQVSGSPFGIAYLTLYNGLSNGTEETIMRTGNLDSVSLDVSNLFSKIIRTTLLQVTQIIPLLGKIIVAPLFFLALLHPFRRHSIATFRWAILLMWSTAAVGLAFFGISTDPLDPNQLHLLFAPVMAAYGLAFVSILWNRHQLVLSNPILRNAHHFVIVIICALPLILAVKPQIQMGFLRKDRGGQPQWPPYYPQRLNSATEGLKSIVAENNTVFSDQPWAVAWYADRTSFWLPAEKKDFALLEEAASRQQRPTTGILISPSSHGSGSIAEVSARFKDFTPLIFDGRIIAATYPPGITIFDKVQNLQQIARRYQYRRLLVGTDMIFYSDRPFEGASTP